MNMRYPNSFEGLASQVEGRFRRLNLRKTGIAVGALAVLAVAWFLIAGTGSKEKGRPPPVVVTQPATVKNVTVVEHAVGTVVANATVQVTAQVTGQLVKAAFQEGQIVKKGDLLFVIDPRPFQAALDQARATLAKDEAQRISAVATQKRYEALFAQNAISSQQHDTAIATAKSASATVDADRAQVETARINLGYTQIRAPVDGKTGPILIQPGNLVSANGSSPLVVLTQIEPVKVSFALPQSDLAAIQARDRAGKLLALLDTHDPKAPKRSAKVDFVSNQINNATGTIELRAYFDNKDHTLVPGQQVDVDVTLNDLPKTTVVPREAINEGPNGRYVFVVTKEQTAEMRPVAVLYDEGTHFMAVKGVKPKERVITEGQLRVVPGAKVSTGKGRVKKP
ncbi:efflux RND transporter periplasmic adaptor subunit [Rhizomicrobium electricum]|uniref:Efflux RND transporter periplasmic adaptor subunit n=1 Tax=Rhizomicrobium electricum TaxID=480070 RepID=A0ABP3PXV2_9PROT|nr:efflux RND transporter periplasmic adaptor subunit [Rhizomicrobium electricum]NIJ49802.1 multidrug efflux system membrane fusion protein [Rhizomicrobium electricum]